MKYFIKKNIHNDFSVFQQNKREPRAYSIPYINKDILLNIEPIKERYSSDMVTVLSGEWNFKFYKSIKSLPDKLDISKINFDKVTVPCDWQRTGHEEPVYLNCPYQIKTLAPEIPDDMPVGLYFKSITLDKVSANEIISFLGVANNLSLYINGKYVGYSEGSHNTAEFEVSEFLNEGINEIVVVSFKWCNGTFLEAQDMFRDNGIFRDVLLYNYSESYINDFEIITEKQENNEYTLKVLTDIKGNFTSVKATLYDADNSVKAECVSSDNMLNFGNLEVTEWNAEIPYLYKMILSVSNNDNEIMSIRNFTGFKTITIDNAVFHFNNVPIKCKGVNHHDTDLYKGYAMSLEDMERDVCLMKEFNVNAVRTSHYPPDPFFVTLADIYGLYVIDEADIETHGCWEMANDVNYISQNLDWAKHYVDRVQRMYYRDRNHPSILMWSLGNESGGYKCHDKCYQYLKSTGTKIPVHYEGVINTKRFHYDVISEMYTGTYAIQDMLKNKRVRGFTEKISKEYSRYPFFLCEYCHAMGVGPGNLEEYWDLFYEMENSMGGCIWEWADHTVYHPDDDKKYKYRYTYGGDHGEKQHDGHFCVDGLMYADRTPHTGAYEMKVVYRPLRASLAGTNLYCIENTNRFRRSDYIDIKWVLFENGAEIDNGVFTSNIAPMQAECFTINHKSISDNKDYHINFVYIDKNTGHEIAVEQLTLNDVDYEYDIEIGSKIAVESENGKVTVKYENGEAVFDAATGTFMSYTVNGKNVLNTLPAESNGFNPNLYRALIDNDAHQIDDWKKSGLDKLKKSLKSFDVHIDDGEADIYCVYVLKAERKNYYEFSVSYIFTSLGAVEIQSSLKVLNENATIDFPRFGLTAELSADYDNVRYYGRGDKENMPDFRCQSPVGIYSAKVDDMYERYVYPQESGMHCDTKWIELSDDAGNKITIYADTVVNFSVHHFTQNAINKAQHQEDIYNMNTTFLTLDGFTRGIGSSSCGPDTREEYKNKDKELSFSFTIIPTKE